MTAQDLGHTVDKLFEAAECNDWTAFAAHFAPGAVLYQNVTGEAVPIEQAIPGLAALVSGGTTLRYENVRRLVGECTVTEFHDAVFTRANGRVVIADICVTLQFDNQGRITRADEYLDSRAVAGLLA